MGERGAGENTELSIGRTGWLLGAMESPGSGPPKPRLSEGIECSDPWVPAGPQTEPRLEEEPGTGVVNPPPAVPEWEARGPRCTNVVDP